MAQNGISYSNGQYGMWVPKQPSTNPDSIADMNSPGYTFVTKNPQPQKAEPVYETVVTEQSNNSANAMYEMYKNLLAQMQAEKDAQVNAAYNSAKDSLNSAKNDSQKQAYIAYMQGLKNMPQISAVAGNGGYSQSLAAKQQLNYENNRNSIENNYINNLKQLESERQAGIIANNQDYLSGMMGLINDYQPETVKTTSNQFTGQYKVGGKTMTTEEYLKYLASLGYSAKEAADYMQSNNLPFK